jgi:hypothetical protein
MDSEFFPTRAIVLSEIPTREKDVYYNLLLDNEARFFEDEDGNYVGSVRLLAPGIKKSQLDVDRHNKQNVAKLLSLPYEERMRSMKTKGSVSVRVAGTEQFDYSPYPRFVSLIADNDDIVKPKTRVLSWVMKIIEDAYDARWTQEKGEGGGGASSASGDDTMAHDATEEGNAHVKMFPVFVVRRLSLTMGLKKVVDQTCWDLLLNIDKYRQDHLEVEVFARFVQEFYGQDELVFFLYARSCLANALHVNFKTRWTRPDQANPKNTQNLWISHRECLAVSRIIFGKEKEELTKDFMALLLPHMVGQRSETADSRRIDVTQFLHLAVVGYHQTRPNAAAAAAAAAAGGAGAAAVPPSVFQGGASGSSGSMSGMQMTPHAGMDLGGGGGGSGADYRSSSAIADSADIVAQFTQVQEDREREFLDFLCESLEERLTRGELEEETVANALNQLYYHLRVKVNAAIGSAEVFHGDLDAFDDALVVILRSDALREEMEALREDFVKSGANKGKR